MFAVGVEEVNILLLGQDFLPVTSQRCQQSLIVVASVSQVSIISLQWDCVSHYLLRFICNVEKSIILGATNVPVGKSSKYSTSVALMLSP